ncbi:MAG: sulfurtransferase-like selenium metabolism protein YedF [Deltaproteobacteria bacterium]|jgi:selenium metabolism protein YedF|nr:sulfurtransferase-like selenium metabolism protein YedF [Deltaproteobacteria bacterium]
MTTINMLGQPCPLPVINAKKALREHRLGQTVTVLVDNDIAVQNLSKMARSLGHQVSLTTQADGSFEVAITIQDLGPETKGHQNSGNLDSGNLVVAISRELMGHGDEKLGKSLLKAFIFSLTEVRPYPEYLLFFNGGAYLTTEGSSSIADLQSLIEKGTIVSTCGACLDFYNLKEKLKVGNVTNMFAIAQTMAQAGRLINI